MKFLESKLSPKSIILLLNMLKTLIILVVIAICLCGYSFAERDGKEKKKRIRSNPQKIALEKWALSLTPKDYNYSEWRIMYHSRSTVDFFNGYAKKLSILFKENNAKVNFAMIGRYPL